jgi:pyroglutamyl-peptidase
LPFPPAARRLVRPARLAGVPAALSHNAGRYVCNYLCWRALESARKRRMLVFFIHVPLVPRGPGGRRRRINAERLSRAGAAILLAATAIAQGKAR